MLNAINLKSVDIEKDWVGVADGKTVAVLCCCGDTGAFGALSTLLRDLRGAGFHTALI